MLERGIPGPAREGAGVGNGALDMVDRFHSLNSG